MGMSGFVSSTVGHLHFPNHRKPKGEESRASVVPSDMQTAITNDAGPSPHLEDHGIWEFPKIRGTLFGGSYNKDPTI